MRALSQTIGIHFDVAGLWIPNCYWATIFPVGMGTLSAISRSELLCLVGIGALVVAASTFFNDRREPLVEAVKVVPIAAPADQYLY
jgi:hypothetical protein